MDSNRKYLLMSLTTFFIFTTMIIPTTQQPCNSYTFLNNHYQSCKDLPTLESSLHWNYDPNKRTVDIAFKRKSTKDSSWIAWAINPTSKGMVGSQALVAFQTSHGIFKAYTSPITTYATTLQEGNLSFPVYTVSSMHVSGSMIIFASLGLTGNATLVNHVWQEGMVSDDGTLRPHTFWGPNVQSFGTLNFAFGNDSESGASAAKVMNSRTTLRIVHGFLNAIGWGILMLIRVILVRYMKECDGKRPVLFHMHRACQSLALLIGTIGFAIGLYMGNHYGVHHTPHRRIGITIISLAFAQVCIDVCLRPKKDHKYRIFWNIFYYIVGYTTVALAIWNVFKGFNILDAHIIWKKIYVGIIVSLLAIALMLEVVTRIWFFEKRAIKCKESISISQEFS